MPEERKSTDMSGYGYSVRMISSATHDVKNEVKTYLLSANQRLPNQTLEQPIRS